MPRKVITQSSMFVPAYAGGVIVPCTIFGLYICSTGTIILETVVADGRHYDILEIDRMELQKFYDELAAEVVRTEW